MKIYQFLETFSDADAIGYQAVGIDRLIRSKGFETEIYANHIDEKCAERVKYFKDFEVENKKTVLLFHHSIGSEVFDYIKVRDGIKKLIFHNVTPPAYFRYRPDFMKILEKGYRQLNEFNGVFTKAICDSKFNREVLRAHGYKNEVTVIPPFVSLENKFGVPVKVRKSKKFRILYVSQIAPHKNQLKLIKIFNVYQKYFNHDSELYVVGGYNPNDSYYQKMAEEAGKNDRVRITGKIPIEQLKKLYESSDLFFSMSEHEGFSVPLVEAMYFGLPIVAYKTGAVSDTLGSGGILLNSDEPLTVAAIIEVVRKNKFLIEEIKTEQSKVMKLYNPLLIEKELSRWLVKN